MRKLILALAIFVLMPMLVKAQSETPKKSMRQARAAIGQGKVTAKSDTSLTVEREGKSYTVTIDNSTKFARRFGGKSTLAEIQVGDTVSVVGKFTDEAKITVLAKLVRDLSVQKRFGAFVGEVKSLTTDGFVMSTVSANRGDQTVALSASSKLVNRKEEVITKADIKVGDRVRVKGLWNSNTDTVTEVTHVKDFSLPEK